MPKSLGFLNDPICFMDAFKVPSNSWAGIRWILSLSYSVEANGRGNWRSFRLKVQIVMIAPFSLQSVFYLDLPKPVQFIILKRLWHFINHLGEVFHFNSMAKSFPGPAALSCCVQSFNVEVILVFIKFCGFLNPTRKPCTLMWDKLKKKKIHCTFAGLKAKAYQK